MDCLVSPMQSVLLIALMLDCGGRQELEKGRKGAREKAGDGEKETEREREREGERECCRNASPGSPSWVGAGLQECSPGESQ